MSKHRHSKDKLHLTYSQLRQQKQTKKYQFDKLPFYCCALSLAPFQDPVCTPQGHVFNILYIMPFIKKYQRNPITGNPLKPNELIKMHWTRSQNPNAINEYQDPISYKIFTQSTHIVCIKTTGNVYSYQTILQLNKKPKNWHDLITQQPFTASDIITIQDPKKQKQRQLCNFDYIKNSLPFIPPDKLTPQINPTNTITKVLQQLDEQKKQKIILQEIQQQKKRKKKQDMKGFIQWCIQNKIYKHQRQTDSTSASLTSTTYTPNQKPLMSFRQLRSSQIRDKIYDQIRKSKMKGYIQMTTNLGTMSFIIHCNLVPKTSQNFLQLSQSGYYNNTSFHKLVKNYSLQAGDPTGTGTGGQSIFGAQFQDEFHPKLTHHKLGILTMANTGPNTNRSQFIITLASCPSLDNKHSVFGQITSNQQLLYKINRQYANEKSDKPKLPITIQKIYCYENPYRKVIKKLKDQHEQGKKSLQLQMKHKQQQRWIQDLKSKFQIPFKSQYDKKCKNTSLSDKILQGYL